MVSALQFIISFITILVMPVSTQSINNEKLKKQISDELAKQPGVYAVAFKNLSTGEELLINEHFSYHAASTMKTPVLIEAYKQAAANKFALTDSILIHNEFKSIVDGSVYSLDLKDDSEPELYAKVGSKVPLKELLYQMIIRSSNLATNLMIELVGAKNVTKTMRRLGAKNTHVLRGVEDSKAYQKGLSNTLTAYDLMRIFTRLAEGKVVNKDASEQMITILLDQKFKDLIPAKLPAEVKVAHKTGWITGTRHDSGIVYLPDGRKYVLVLMSKGITDDKAGIHAMATVSRLIYDHVIGKK
ncbi:MAG TPA: serine hydrolase [Sphingobacteriaceae bacterium]|nr:serine hydrolase [Sphingobacteriaceae bacterium]